MLNLKYFAKLRVAIWQEYKKNPIITLQTEIDRILFMVDTAVGIQVGKWAFLEFRRAFLFGVFFYMFFIFSYTNPGFHRI